MLAYFEDSYNSYPIPSADGRLLNMTYSDDHVGFSVPLANCILLYSLQPAHVLTGIVSESAALKTEMRGHDNRIECVLFVPWYQS